MAGDEEAAGGDEQPLDLTPLLSLSPMFPTPPGYDLVATQPPDPPFLYVTPRSSSNRPAPAPSPAPVPASAPVSLVPLNVTPISMVFPAPATPSHNDDDSSDQDYTPFREKRTQAAAAKRRTRQGGDGDSKAASIKRRKPRRRCIDKELLLAGGWSSPSNTNPRDSVGAAMAMFDSLRRNMLQLDEKEGRRQRADLEASALMMKSNLKVNNLKTIGPVPGIEIGDIFFYRMEMCAVGLHAPSMAGIDYISARHGAGKDETLAVSIISSGGYENDDDDTDTLVYTGHGGSGRYKEKHDQKLERGNLALMNSSNKKNQIRVVRGAPDPFSKLLGKIYVYDGIYRIEDSWMDTAENGFNVFKYRLRREPGQPDGISVWKMAAKWRADRGTRENVILSDLSSNAENLPVCLVNDVDNEKRPPHFEYVTGVKYSGSLSRNEPLQSCKCSTVCSPGDSNCSCARRNGGDFPYSTSGLLVKHVPMLYECSTNCHCSQDCRNRVAQKGVSLNFEVFWTGDRGWGLRSWDPIRAGTFICEYAGEVSDETKISTEEDDDYTFQASCPNDKVLKWNIGAELLEGECSDSTTSQTFKQLPIIIRAKDAGNVARFLNHSCSPNLLWQAVQYDHGDDGYPHIVFFAMQHIPPMTELTYDYGVRGAPPGKFTGACKLKPCLCGSTNCRGSF